MAKSYGSRKKSSFSQKKKNLAENEELRESGMLDMLSNRQRLYAEYDETCKITVRECGYVDRILNHFTKMCGAHTITYPLSIMSNLPLNIRDEPIIPLPVELFLHVAAGFQRGHQLDHKQVACGNIV